MLGRAILCLALVAGTLAALPLQKNHGSTVSQSTSLHGDDELPRFSWTISHPDRGQSQTAYQLTVFSAPSVVYWDSGVVKSNRTSFIPYEGPGLAAETTYTWSVVWWDANNVAAPVSALASFETGILDWNKSEWITSGLNQALYRKDFTLAQDVTKATLYMVGMGFFDGYVNGELVTDYFGNGWTTFRKRLLYSQMDVTSLIKAGANTIGASTSLGWADWNSFPSRTGGDKFGPPTFRALLRVKLADGSVITVGSDDTWTYDRSPVLQATVYDGESYDARLEQDGWATPTFQPPFFGFWLPAKIVDSPTTVVTRLMHEPIRHISTFAPLSITEPQPGVYVVKFPHNISGMARLKNIRGAAGHKITLRHAEVLIHPPYTGAAGMIYTENLRSAKATDEYILKGDSNGETWSPRNTYHGFQYIEVTNFPGTLTADNIEALFVATDVQARGTLNFGSALLNNLQERVVRGQHDNLMSVPTDCNQRDERLGWMGDVNLSADSMALNFDIRAFFANYLRLIRDEQGDDGTVPDVVPSARYASRPGDTSWATAYTTLAWAIYRYYGDVMPAMEQQKGLEAFVWWMDNYVKQNNIRNMYATYGDWCPPPPMPKADEHLTAAYSYVAALRMMSELEAAMGNSGTARTMEQEHQNMVLAFEGAFYDNSTHKIDLNVQTDMALSLDLGISAFPKVADNLINDLLHENNLHFTTGIIGLKALFPVLTALKRNDVALDVAQQITYPSFGYEAANTLEPADTIWELMDAPVEGPGMNSRNHHMFSSISGWLYTLAGLEQPLGVAGAGFDHVNLVARPMPGLQSASVQMKAPRGVISFSWSQTGGNQCEKVTENSVMVLSCGAGGVIKKIDGSFGRPNGGCATGFTANPACHAKNTQKVLEGFCLGKQTCNITASTAEFMDPCANEVKLLVASIVCSNKAKLTTSAIVPPGTTSTVKLPTMGASARDVRVTESGSLWWDNGIFVGDEDNGVSSATATDDSVSFEIGSGEYEFVLSL